MRALARATSLFAAAGIAPALAHPGHATPPGVAAARHVHLSGDLAVSPEWLLLTGSLALGMAALAWHLRRRRAARAPSRQHPG